MTTFPWYDSPWLQAFIKAKAIIQQHHPERLAAFIAAFEPLRTRPDYAVVECPQLLSPERLTEIRAIIQEISSREFEKQELFSFGRLVVHDLPYFTQLQEELAAYVSTCVGEEVEPRYNFLSLYNNLGVCKIHMDAPSAKWTLDICLNHSGVWPIHFSQIVPWPEDFGYTGADWEAHIKADPGNHFTTYELTPGNGIIFSGSSQWHYRDRILRVTKDNFCHLLFLHYIPKGTRALTSPKKWAEYFGIPEFGRLDGGFESTYNQGGRFV